MAGWIKLHRSIKDHWLFSFKHPDKALAWIDLIVSASFEDHRIMINGRFQEIKRGEVAMSQITLQKRWRWSQNKVKRFLKLLENDGMIELKTNELTTIIKILNYNDFQDKAKSNERTLKRSKERGTDDHTDDNQEGKEIKEVKKDKYSEDFLKFWGTWNPKRKGDSKYKSSLTFESMIKQGVTLETMIAFYNREKFDPEFVPLMSSWLNKRMWENDDGEAPACKWTNLLNYFLSDGYWSEDNGPAPTIDGTVQGAINPECQAPVELINKVLSRGPLI